MNGAPEVWVGFYLVSIPGFYETGAEVLKKAKYVCLALLLVVAAYEIMLFAWSIIAEHKAERLTELLATFKPGYTTEDSAIALFRAHGLNVAVPSNACTPPNGSCDGLFVGASNSRSVIFNRDRLMGIDLMPLPPLRPAAFWVNLYFINGILDSINLGYRVGTTLVAYSRGAGDYPVRVSEWRYANRGMVTWIGVSTSGAAFVPFPHLALNYMHSMKCTDARTLWPTAPPSTEEHHGRPGCREN